MKKNRIIPTIDLLPLWNNADGIQIVAEQINKVFKELGFAYLCNHQVPSHLIKTVFKESKDFHALPLETKMKIKQNDSFRGYMPLNASKFKVSTQGIATKPNQSAAFIMAFDLPEDSPDYKIGAYLAGPNQWPEEPLSFRANINSYRDAMLKLAWKLLEVFSVALGMEPQELNQFFINPSYFLRLQYYPSQSPDTSENQFGIAPHTDYGFFTILAQDDVGGLEIKYNDSDEWVSVPFMPDTFVLNAGDMLKRWSNNKFRSIPHRVINRSTKDRYSIPFFFEPNMHAMIKVLESCIDDDNQPQYPPIMYGEYLLDRVQGNYGLGRRNENSKGKNNV